MFEIEIPHLHIYVLKLGVYKYHDTTWSLSFHFILSITHISAANISFLLV